MNTYDGRDGEDFRSDDEDFDTDMITINPPRWQRWRPGRPITVAGVAVLALASGAGIGYAATHSVAKPAAATTVSAPAAPSPSASPAPSGSGSGSGTGHAWHGFAGRFPGGLPGQFFLGPIGGGVVHGVLTVPKSGGGYQTVDVQSGTVTAVSGTSVTVKSADGYTATYAVSSKTIVDAQAAGIGSVKKGDSIFVTATVSGSTATAANVLDMTALKAGRAAFGFPMRPANPPAQALPAQAPNA
jgi:hypothetical protein